MQGRRAGRWTLVFIMLAVPVSGCVGADDPAEAPDLLAPGSIVAVSAVDSVGEPLAFAPVTVLGDAGVLSATATDAEGRADLTVPATATEVAVSNGTHLVVVPLDAAVLRIIVDQETAAPIDPTSPAAGLTPAFLHDLGSAAYLYSANAALCRDPTEVPPSMTHDCGLSEPSIEVAGDGTLYATAVCCVAAAPPVWVSRDNGATWTTLDTPLGQREAFGTEGDFAIDDAGNVYFIDTDVAAMQVTAWTPDGTHLHTTHFPLPPVTDRPWIRAEGDGTVYLAYNTGAGGVLGGVFVKSTDHGRTWPLTTMTTLPGGFPNIARGTAPGELWLSDAARGAVTMHHSTDGGDTWTVDGTIDLEGSLWGFAVPVVDTNGTPYLVAPVLPGDDPNDPEDDEQHGGVHVAVAHRGADGWGTPILMSPPGSTNAMPWPAAGADGVLAIAWYSVLDEDIVSYAVSDAAAWHLMLSVTLDATAEAPSWQTIVADPVPVVEGQIGRRLLDFLQVDIGPDGAVHVAYAHDPEDTGKETTVYLQTLANLPLVDPALGIFNGPRAA